MDNNKYHEATMKTIEENIKIYDERIKENNNAGEIRTLVWRIINWSFSAGYHFFHEELLEFINADEIIRDRVRSEI